MTVNIVKKQVVSDLLFCLVVVGCYPTAMLSCLSSVKTMAAMMAPVMGPKTGIHEYPQSLPPLFLMGTSA